MSGARAGVAAVNARRAETMSILQNKPGARESCEISLIGASKHKCQRLQVSSSSRGAIGNPSMKLKFPDASVRLTELKRLYSCIPASVAKAAGSAVHT
eukprot:1942773-Prymnesium_polylepis.1